jgi:hypothetical protein
MRIVSWNMGMHEQRFKAPGNHDRSWHYLLGLGPDLAFVQETLPPGWVRGEGELHCQAISTWGSAIFSPRYPVRPFVLPSESRLRRLGAYLGYGRASLPDGSDRLVVSIHARAKPATAKQLGDADVGSMKRPSLAKTMVNDLIFSELKEMVGDGFIVAGDWNTGRTQSDRKAGEEFFDRMKRHHWYDCVWDTFQREERTWFREGDKLKQDDHAFCDEALGKRVRRAWASEDAVLRLGLSDHAPLVIDFDVPSIAMSHL